MIPALILCLGIAAQGREVIGAEEDPDDPSVIVPPTSDDPADLAPLPKQKQAAPRSVTRPLPDGPRTRQPSVASNETAARAIRGGSCAGCIAGGLVAGGTAFAPVVLQGIGIDPCTFACTVAGVGGCGVCTSAGAVIGAGVGAKAVHLEPLELSPWLLAGVGVGVATVVLPVGLFLTQSAGVFIPGDMQGPMVVLWAALVLAAGPVTVAATFLTEPPPPEGE